VGANVDGANVDGANVDEATHPTHDIQSIYIKKNKKFLSISK